MGRAVAGRYPVAGTGRGMRAAPAARPGAGGVPGRRAGRRRLLPRPVRGRLALRRLRAGRRRPRRRRRPAAARGPRPDRLGAGGPQLLPVRPLFRGVPGGGPAVHPAARRRGLRRDPGRDGGRGPAAARVAPAPADAAVLPAGERGHRRRARLPADPAGRRQPGRPAPRPPPPARRSCAPASCGRRSSATCPRSSSWTSGTSVLCCSPVCSWRAGRRAWWPAPAVRAAS